MIGENNVFIQHMQRDFITVGGSGNDPFCICEFMFCG
jgi:hypothetical protein